MYHAAIQRLDEAASAFHDAGLLREKQECFYLAGQFQNKLLAESPYGPQPRFMHQQWVWALGHIGLLHQYLRATDPASIVVLFAPGSANNQFLSAILDRFHNLKMVWPMPAVSCDAAMRNAVYFGCPDGRSTLVDYNKSIERQFKGQGLLKLTNRQNLLCKALMENLRISHPYIALQPRNVLSDPARNVTKTQIMEAINRFPGHDIVVTGIDPHDLSFASVHTCEDPREASFLLSANCDQFIGSNSGAWVIPHAYGKPVHIINDHQRSAWIYD